MFCCRHYKVFFFLTESGAIAFGELMKRGNSIVRFNDNISHLGRMYKRVCTQNTVRLFFVYLEIQMGTKYGADTVVKKKSRLKILKAIYVFSFYTDNNTRFDELITFMIVTICLTVISKKLSINKAMNSKKLTI